MATVQELQAQIARARADEDRLRAETRQFETDRQRLFAERRALGPELERQRQIIQDPNATEAQKNAAVDRATAIENEANAIGRQISQSSRDEQQFIDSQLNPATGRRQDLQQQLRVAQQQAATQQRARDDAGPNTVGSGTVVVEAQTARDDGANPTLPVSTSPPQPTPTNATPIATSSGEDVGTDDRERRITETQSPNLDSPDFVDSEIEVRTAPDGQPIIEVGLIRNRPGSEPGTGAPGDDQGRVSGALPTTTVTAARIDELYGSKNATIVPASNALSKFASYTYSLSWYLVDPEAYRELVSRQKRSLNGFYLLVQSAGIGQNTATTVAENQSLAVNQQSPQVTAASAGRNQFFPFDYYIDNFETQILYPNGGESQSAARFTELSFTLTEPNGLTLLPNLYRACEDLIKQGGQTIVESNDTNYAASMFCMVVRFYGYDENGVLQKPINNTGDTTDSTAVVEKFIPFVLKNIKFSVGARMIEYTIEGASPEVRTGLATNRGSIPQDFEFSGITVQDILVGASPPAARNGATDNTERPESALPVGNTLPPVTPKADSAPRSVTDTVPTGLVAALTEFQKRQLREEKIEHADVYEIKFADNIISNAKVVPPGGLNKNRVGGTSTTTAAEKKLPDKTAIAPASRSRGVRAGTQIVQFIDEVIRSSSYITDQQAVIYDEKTREYSPNGKTAEQFAWFNIVVSVEQLAYDTKRKDYAYKMTFFVTPYEVPMISEYFAPSGFRGHHKVYNWLFTGENTEVLTFEQNFDKLWTQALTADTRILESIVNQKRRMNSREQWPKHYYPASAESAQGGEGKVFEAGANAADFLYGPDYARINLNIVGDPAWMPNAYYDNNTNTFSSTPFWPDGGINTTAGAAYFELAFNRPVDYNLNTGLMDTGEKNYFADRDNGQAGLAAEAQTYYAVRSKSIFRGGRFSQELEGAWMWDQTFNEPIDQRTAQNAPTVRPSQELPGSSAGQQIPGGAQGNSQQENLNKLSAANQPVQDPGSVAADGARSASTVIGGVTIRAVLDPELDRTGAGAVFVLDRGGLQEFVARADANRIGSAALRLQSRTSGVNANDVINWANGGGADQLIQQIPPPPSPAATPQQKIVKEE